MPITVLNHPLLEDFEKSLLDYLLKKQGRALGWLVSIYHYFLTVHQIHASG